MCEDAPCCGCCGWNATEGMYSGEYYAEEFYERQERYDYEEDEDDE